MSRRRLEPDATAPPKRDFIGVQYQRARPEQSARAARHAQRALAGEALDAKLDAVLGRADYVAHYFGESEGE